MRSAGILMPVTALPSPWGVGTLGAEARSFIDFLVASGQSIWQLLPICPTSYGDSPYQSCSSFAGNPYLIDLDDLCDEGLLEPDEYQTIAWGSDPACVDYGLLYEQRFGVLRHAVRRLLDARRDEFEEFCAREHAWLEDYALFMAIKGACGGEALGAWDEPLRLRDPEALAAASAELTDEVLFWKGVQCLFFNQWERLRAYAHERGIRLMGDMPIYVAEDSADLWAHPDQFQLDDDLRPIEVAGCPPDGFSATGQLWGNPLFAWDEMAEDGFSWWIERIRFQLGLYDILRIDHFRGFDSYFAIPAGADTAAGGRWREGPGTAFFDTIERELGQCPIVAEDLGFLTPSVYELLEYTGCPGMKVLQFAFDSRDGGGRVYQPHNFVKNCVAYVGTHDNDTALGWLETADPGDVELARAYLHLDEREGEGWGMMRAIWSSVADTAIVMMQDLLELGSEARINTPSTLGGNWCWRALPGFASEELASRLHRQMELYERLPERG
ncbi:4-alpha-glucanotransferase [uncultured Enorma sp.]|uniref:4-alpha-glucanotransferase n=1 Tax=uncultured Enorma sp. TaxID=1714346 RepID=UPI002803854E|nr:4-alpha-glucanotransferase [uncultured Enorma sp.]